MYHILHYIQYIPLSKYHIYTCYHGLDVRQPLVTVTPSGSVTCVKYSHRFTLPKPLPSWIRPLPLEPWPHWPCPPDLSCGWTCRAGGEPEKLDGERLRPCGAPPSRTSWREGEELSERCREDDELRGRGGGLKSITLRSCISWVRLARKSASLVLLARTLNRRRLEKKKARKYDSSAFIIQIHNPYNLGKIKPCFDCIFFLTNDYLRDLYFYDYLSSLS